MTPHFPPHELEPPGETPEPGGSSQPDPAVALIGHATDAAFLTVAALLAVVVTVLIVLVTS